MTQPKSENDSAVTASAPLVDRHVFLDGRPPLGEYLGFLKSMAVDGEASDLRALSDEWRQANDHIRELEKQEAGIANNLETSPLPPELDELRGKVLADPIYRRSFSIVPTTFAMVELDPLVVFQKHINLDHVRRIQEALGRSPSAEAVFRCCMQLDHPQPPVKRLPTGNAYVFMSPSTDLRVHELTLLASHQISEYSPQGPISGVVGIVVGFGSNFLNVISAEGRLVLNNGSHRAYALRDIGITHVPCIVQHVSRREELEVMAAGLQPNPDVYFKAGRPPLLKDYFDAKLRKLVDVPRRLRQIRVAFQVEQIDVPATS